MPETILGNAILQASYIVWLRTHTESRYSAEIDMGWKYVHVYH